MWRVSCAADISALLLQPDQLQLLWQIWASVEPLNMSRPGIPWIRTACCECYGKSTYGWFYRISFCFHILLKRPGYFAPLLLPAQRWGHLCSRSTRSPIELRALPLGRTETTTGLPGPLKALSQLAWTSVLHLRPLSWFKFSKLWSVRWRTGLSWPICYLPLVIRLCSSDSAQGLGGVFMNSRTWYMAQSMAHYMWLTMSGIA